MATEDNFLTSAVRGRRGGGGGRSSGPSVLGSRTNRYAASTVRTTGGDPTPSVFNPKSQTEAAIGSAVTTFGNVLSRYISQSAIREKQWRDNQFLAATPLAQQKFDYTLKRELRKFYRTDGEDVTPEAGYSVDLGFGVSFNGESLLDETGTRRTFAEAVDFYQNQFIEGRKKMAPSVNADGKATQLLEEGKFRSQIDAQVYVGKRHGLKLANSYNTVVRAYKDVVAVDQGFNPEVFGQHMDAMKKLMVSSSNVVDPGAAFTAFREAAGDLLAVGVTDAALNRDNEMAIKLLAVSPLRDTRELRSVMSGLSAEDFKYLEQERKRFKKGPRFKLGDRPPKNTLHYFEWAYAQQDDKRQAELQKRSLEAFDSQTRQVREEIEARVRGLLSAVSSPAIKDSAFRQNIRKSADKALRDIGRVYPADLFPNKHNELVAKVLVGGEAINIRNLFNTVPTRELDAVAQNEVVRIGQKIMKAIGKKGAIASLPLQNQAQKVLYTFAQNEKRMRQEDPYGSLQRIAKDVREIDNRLSEGTYTTIGEKFRDQTILRRRVLEKSGKLGIRPSFLSGNDAEVLKGLSKLGNIPELMTVVEQVRDKYGESIFFDYIVPEIGGKKQLGSQVGAIAMIPDKAVFSLAMQAKVNAAENRKLIEKSDEAEYKDEVSATNWWIIDPFDRYKYGVRPLERLNNRIDDLTGDPAARSHLKTSLRSLVRDMVYQKVATGQVSEQYGGWWYGGGAEGAMYETIDTLIAALGRPMEFQGRETIVPETFPLNEPRVEVLEEVLFNPKFLADRVVPHIVPNASIMAKAEAEGETLEQTIMRFFLHDDIVTWHPGYEGIVPAIQNPIFPGHVTAFQDKKGYPFLLPYGDLDDIIVKETYK